MSLGPIIDEFMTLVAGSGTLDIEEDPVNGIVAVIWTYKTGVGATVPFHMGFYMDKDTAALTAYVEGDEVAPSEALDTAKQIIS